MPAIKAPFSINDLNILIEALDAWIDKDTAAFMWRGMIESLGNTSESEFMRKQEDAIRKLAYDKSQREEIATLMKAKLITLRREMEAEEAVR